LHWIDFVLMIAHLGHFRSHPEFSACHHDVQTAIPDRKRQRNPGQVAAEIGKGFPT
jgi:hypothetical protein